MLGFKQRVPILLPKFDGNVRGYKIENKIPSRSTTVGSVAGVTSYIETAYKIVN